MLLGPRQLRRRRAPGNVAHGATSTLDPSSTGRDVDHEGTDRDGHADMFGDVPPDVRLQMELIACATDAPEDALPNIIALLVEGSAAKRAAIVAAIMNNDPLREQWERTWAVLRG